MLHPNKQFRFLPLYRGLDVLSRVTSAILGINFGIAFFRRLRTRAPALADCTYVHAIFMRTHLYFTCILLFRGCCTALSKLEVIAHPRWLTASSPHNSNICVRHSRADRCSFIHTFHSLGGFEPRDPLEVVAHPRWLTAPSPQQGHPRRTCASQTR